MANNKLSKMDRLLTKARYEGDCLVWAGDTGSNGYGRLRHAGCESYPAHKLMYELHHGKVPAGLVVRHRCDNRPCINVAHLEVGTHKDNAQDRVKRGRSRNVSGEHHGRSKLTQAQVDEIRRRYIPGRYGSGSHVLAREFGVTQSTIFAILRGKHWRTA